MQQLSGALKRLDWDPTRPQVLDYAAPSLTGCRVTKCFFIGPHVPVIKPIHIDGDSVADVALNTRCTPTIQLCIRQEYVIIEVCVLFASMFSSAPSRSPPLPPAAVVYIYVHLAV